MIFYPCIHRQLESFIDFQSYFKYWVSALVKREPEFDMVTRMESATMDAAIRCETMPYAGFVIYIAMMNGNDAINVTAPFSRLFCSPLPLLEH